MNKNAKTKSTKTKPRVVKGKNKTAPPPAPCRPWWGG